MIQGPQSGRPGEAGLFLGWRNLAEGPSGQSGPHALHVSGRIQADAATLQLALAPALLILLTHLQQLLSWGKWGWSLPIALAQPRSCN